MAAPRLDADRDAHLGTIYLALPQRSRPAKKPGNPKPLQKPKRPIAMGAPSKPAAPPANVAPSKGKPSPLIDPSNEGDWGEVDKSLTFKSLSRLLTRAAGREVEFPRCSPTNLGPVLDSYATGIAGKEEKPGDGWNRAFEEAPLFHASPEPTSINMALKPRDRREARRLRGLPPILMSASSPPASADAVAGDWGDIDLDSLFPAIHQLVQAIDPKAEFLPCKPGDLGKELANAADALEKAPEAADAAPPVVMRLKAKPGRPVRSSGITAADRAAARRLRRLPNK